MLKEDRKELFKFCKEVFSNITVDLANMYRDNKFYDYDTTDDIESTLFIETDADWVETGASKIVFHFSEYPEWVIKIPFCGYYDYSDDSAHEFQNADNEGMLKCLSNDYCEAEQELYQYAKDYDIQQCLAGTYYLGTYNDISIYCSEYCECSSWNYGYNNYGSAIEKSSKYDNTNCSIQTYAAQFIDCYGEKVFQRLVNFCQEWEISDLHSENIRVTEDNKIKIIDYSSYRD